ncbi:beta-N-acetylhexosaminidase [Prevotella nanceiensis]|uniref:beta-N-acetylhexosaminidase n=1 Tax=Hoylesella nanceiensis TaxID=425941 RepID=UPI001C5F9E5B|nr:beta-N-acetylhexosaminidase [Hoylesella nanceiensis]MBW4766140.1 beta-N-acetylhexosaminidase [Hoylesella nanceiensis]
MTFKKLFTPFCLLAMIPCHSLAQTLVANYNVVPQPQEIKQVKSKPFMLTASTTIVSLNDSEEMRRNAQFLKEYIADVCKLNLAVDSKKGTSSIILAIDPKIKNSEGYSIVVNSKGVVIKGATAQGVFYGVQTLRKSLPITTVAGSIELAPVVIDDAPRFGYRGMMLDCARHFFPLEFVKRYIDLLAMHNMNVFHWHLTEDQGWRLEIKKYPELTQKGSIRQGTQVGHNDGVFDGVPYGGYYTQEQAREIVEYARQRYITVIPEFDIPGHTKAALACYPELGCTGGPYQVARSWGVFQDVLCLGKEKTFTFVQDVLDEIMDIFPSKVIHIGGDEAPTVAWEQCPLCQKKMKEEGVDAKHFQGYFTNRIEKYLNSKGHSIMGWDEILEGKISTTATVMSWRGAEPGIQAALKGHDVVMTPNTHNYFDYYQANDKEEKKLGLIGGLSTVENVYNYNPTPSVLPDSVRKHILGVQANLWTEYIAGKDIAEYQILPRMAALAEVQWTTQPKNYEGFKERLTRFVSFYDLYNYVYATHLWKDKKAKPEWSLTK